ncbi:MAG: ceramidase [Burkholderiaceae bacterium]|nr:ceramidase [Burkholderiaceae bacterium]MCD8516645.1 ceramidase [Burkholderiaceae bacterium]MCD8537959.1 ceramidase [Burkholderiaceae bacterium]MCD8564781.1 ceramidase [Burkholderiaceae bacterium]
MLHWFEPANIYCERTDPSFWSEPVNALTNLAFVVAGLLLIAQRRPPARLLGTLIVLIGLGSFLFHTFANRLTGFLDVFFIGVYLIAYAWLWPRWVTNAGFVIRSSSVVALILLIGMASASVAWLKPLAPGLPPGAYLGAWFYVIALATLSATNQRRAGIWLWATAGLFLVSMTARQLDLPLCEQLGGSHWLWHVMNAGVLYASARALLIGAEYSGSETMRQVKA